MSATASAPPTNPPAAAPTATPPGPAAPPVSLRAVLRHRSFRGLAAGGLMYFIGGAMQGMAAAWMMVELSGSAFLVSLVQTATFLPMFLLALPGGVLADIADRGRLIRLALWVQCAAMALQALLLALGWGGSGLLLTLLFVCGCCTALLSPAWNTTIADAVPREELPQAIVVVAIAYNVARAFGPMVAGAVFAWLGGPWVFVLALAATLAMLRSIRRWPPKAHPPSKLPAERLFGGMRSALRFAWHSPRVLAQLLRTMAFCGAGSALWALLPVIGSRQLGLGAAGFGGLIACLGVGAIAIGLQIGRLRGRFGPERVVGASCVGFALAMLAVVWLRWAPAVYGALVLAGAAWLACNSTFNAATQTSAPPWVRSRAAALHVLSALGAFALGSALWGALEALLGLKATLTLAAVAMAGGLLLRYPLPLRMGRERDVTPAVPWQDLVVHDEPEPEAGPVAVEIVYRIDPAQAAAFMDTLAAMKAPRRRDGASLWRIYRDLEDPTRYIERFIVASWADYLHQRSRATQTDQEREARVRAFQLEGVPVQIQHFIAER